MTVRLQEGDLEEDEEEKVVVAAIFTCEIRGEFAQHATRATATQTTDR